MNILHWFPNPRKFVNEVLEILWFGCFVVKGVLQLLRYYVLADAEVWEASQKVRIAVLVTWIRSKCLASGLLSQGLKHRCSALSPSQAIFMCPPVKSWYDASSWRVSAIPYRPDSLLRYAHWSFWTPGVIRLPLPSVAFISL